MKKTPAIEARERLRAHGAAPISANRPDGRDVWRDREGRNFCYTTDGKIYLLNLETDVAEETTLADLVKEYNALVPKSKRVKKFKDKGTATRRVEEAKAEKKVGKRGPRASDETKLKFPKSPEGKIWHEGSLRSQVFKRFENSTITLGEACSRSFGEATPAQIRSAIGILVKDGFVERIEK